MPARRLLTLISLLLLLAACLSGPTPGSAQNFYEATGADLNGPPGSLIRLEGMNIQLTTAMVYRILYRSTGLDGRIIPVSGMVIAPFREPPPGGWPVIAWAHPTTGIARSCAPSSMYPDPVNVIPGINEMLERGYVVAATDYPGLGTRGPHPYLVGVSEARAVLDSVRAAREMREARAGDRFVVWGHSQGGQAALYTGELAASYAPELKLFGIAAAAPATELGPLFRDDRGSLSGRILSALWLDSMSQLYRAPLDTVADPAVIPMIEAVGRNCIDFVNGELRDLDVARNFPARLLKSDPTQIEPWKKFIAENTPGRAAPGGPLFIGQGTADQIVDPPVTVNFVSKLCARGAAVRFIEYPGASHEQIAKRSARDAMAWMHGRFAGEPAPSNCGG
jgi:pimeloyl-ACP methyl ester carboxylesterase